MSDFVPEGYLRIRSASDQALKQWLGKKISSIRKKIEKQLEQEQAKAVEALSLTDSPTNRIREAFITRGLSEDFEWKFTEACREQVDETHRRLRNALHKGEITAFYFSTTDPREEPSSIERAFWTSSAAANVIDKGVYFPFGPRPPGFSVGYYPSEQVLVREEEWKRFLSGKAIAPPPASPPSKPRVVRKKGRPRGTGHQQSDDALVDEMHELIQSSKLKSPTEAAHKLVSKASGSGIRESIVKRLASRYREKFG